MCDNDRQKQEELRMMYQLDTQAMEHFKQRQWDVVRYGLMLCAAAIGFDKLVAAAFASHHATLTVMRWAEIIVILLVFFAGLTLLQSLEIAVIKCRQRKNGAKAKFTSEFQGILDSGDYIKNHQIPRPRFIKTVHTRERKNQDGTGNQKYESRSPYGFFVATLILGCIASLSYLGLNLLFDCP